MRVKSPASMACAGSRKCSIPTVLSAFLVAIQWGFNDCAQSHKHYTEQTLKTFDLFHRAAERYLAPNYRVRVMTAPLLLPPCLPQHGWPAATRGRSCPLQEQSEGFVTLGQFSGLAATYLPSVKINNILRCVIFFFK